MEQQPEFVMYRVRDFGEVINDTFVYMRLHARSLFRNIMRNIFPAVVLIVIGSAFYLYWVSEITSFTNSGDESLSIPTTVNDPFRFLALFSLPLFVYILFIMLVYTYSISCLMCYFVLSKEQGTEVDLDEVRRMALQRFLPLIGLHFLLGLLITVGYVFCILPGIWVAILLSVSVPAFFIENISPTDALSRSSTLIKGYWWWSLLTAAILYLLVYIMQLVLSLPAILLQIGDGLLNFERLTTRMPEYSMTYILSSSAFGLLTNTAGMFIWCIFFYGMCMHYMSLVEKKEGVGLAQQVASISSGDNSSSPTPFGA